MEWKSGQCHCGAIQFRVRGDFQIAVECDCSICQMRGFLHLIVEAEDFQWSQGRETIREYRFNTETATHYFCDTCGITPFYIPRSHPEGFSVNLRCVDGVDLSTVRRRPFHGRDWEASIDTLREE